MPDQAAYDDALAIAQLILTRLLPAFFASSPARPTDLPLLLPTPPALLAGLTTPLPASLTGDERVLDSAKILADGLAAVDALSVKMGAGWALKAA